MNLIEAIKSGRPFRRKGAAGDWNPNRNDTARWSVTKESLLADDWEIQEPTATITRTQFWNAVEETQNLFWPNPSANELARKLGLED